MTSKNQTSTPRVNTRNVLPKLKTRTLNADELCQVTGGMPPETHFSSCMTSTDNTAEGDP